MKGGILNSMTVSKRFGRMISFIIVLAAVALLIAPLATAKAETGAPIGVAVCTAKRSLKLRSGPSTKCDVVVKLPARAFVKVYAQSGKWYQIEYNGIIAWGQVAYLSFAAYPSASVTAQGAERTYTLYYQGDSQWRFSRSVRKKACIMSSYAIMINNMGIPATPRFIYESNKRRTVMNYANLTTNFGVTPICALAPDSPYLQGFNGACTYVINPCDNGIAAIKEAINRHPEGVICYFKKGSRAHAVVACKYDGDTIYFSDAGRKKSTLLTFAETWVSHNHRMTYKHLAYIAALDTVAEVTACQ